MNLSTSVLLLWVQCSSLCNFFSSLKFGYASAHYVLDLIKATIWYLMYLKFVMRFHHGYLWYFDTFSWLNFLHFKWYYTPAIERFFNIEEKKKRIHCSKSYLCKRRNTLIHIFSVGIHCLRNWKDKIVI